MSHLKVSLWPHLLQRVTSGHLLLELLLQLLAGADGLLVAGEVRQLLQPGVGEVLRKMLAAPFVGRKEFLRRRRMFTHQ